MSPQGGTSPSVESRSAQEGHRGCVSPICAQVCSKISQVLRPPDGQLGPCCLLRGWLADGGRELMLAEQRGDRTGGPKGHGETGEPPTSS